MFQKLDELEKRYVFLSEQLADSDVIADMNTWKKYSKEHADLRETAEKYREYLNLVTELVEAWIAKQKKELDYITDDKIAEYKKELHFVGLDFDFKG